jgi:hypothetical protein
MLRTCIVQCVPIKPRFRIVPILLAVFGIASPGWHLLVAWLTFLRGVLSSKLMEDVGTVGVDSCLFEDIFFIFSVSVVTFSF